MKLGALAVLAAVVLMVISLLNVQHVVEVDYGVVNYGFPLPWLVYYIYATVYVNRWFLDGFGLVVDYLFWIAVSLAIIWAVRMLGAFRDSHDMSRNPLAESTGV